MTALAAAPLTIHRSRKLIPDFRLHRPRTVAEAVATKTLCGADAVFMAGGIDVVNRMKFGTPVTDVIHLSGVAGLDGIEEDDGELRLGALVTHDRMAMSLILRSRLPALAETWPDVANIRIRMKGTLGGNIMAGDPNYDFVLAAMAANARLHFHAQDGDTEIAAADASTTDPDALLTAITFPTADALRLVFDRSLRPIVTLVLGLDIDDGAITGGRVAIGCAYAAPVAVALPFDEPLPPADLSVRGATIAEQFAAGLPEPRRDQYAGPAYRRRMIEVLLRRNLAALQ
jgi:carbon-monoxide dehydrogenase medium subunit